MRWEEGSEFLEWGYVYVVCLKKVLKFYVFIRVDCAWNCNRQREDRGCIKFRVGVVFECSGHISKTHGVVLL